MTTCLLCAFCDGFRRWVLKCLSEHTGRLTKHGETLQEEAFGYGRSWKQQWSNCTLRRRDGTGADNKL